MDESRIGQYSISVTTYPIMALLIVSKKKLHFNIYFQDIIWIYIVKNLKKKKFSYLVEILQNQFFKGVFLWLLVENGFV